MGGFGISIGAVAGNVHQLQVATALFVRQLQVARRFVPRISTNAGPANSFSLLLSKFVVYYLLYKTAFRFPSTGRRHLSCPKRAFCAFMPLPSAPLLSARLSPGMKLFTGGHAMYRQLTT